MPDVSKCSLELCRNHVSNHHPVQLIPDPNRVEYVPSFGEPAHAGSKNSLVSI